DSLSANELRQGVLEFNKHFGGNSATFIDVPFGPNNAYAAPDTWLWLVPTPPIARDQVFDQRQQVCGAVTGAEPTCRPASMGHPNVKGAEAYAKAIIGAIAPYAAEWRSLHA